MKICLHYLGVALIIVLSFLCYSSNFYPLLGSDDAIQVLMIHDFKLPHDLYFWGQDRYGSLIPLLGQVFYKGFGISPLTSESISHYLLLVAGYFAFATLLKTKFSKLVFAFIWFFPPIRMIDLLRLNIGEAYSLLAISIFLLNKLYENEISRYGLKQHFLLLLITLMFVLSVWVSDLAIISVFLILSLQIYFVFISRSQTSVISFFRKPEFYYTVAGVVFGTAFILYGKHLADKSPSYNNFNNLHTIIASLKMFGDSIFDLLLFKAAEPFTSVYLYLTIVLLISLILMQHKIHLGNIEKKWFLFFVFDLFLIFGAILISKWSFMNGVPRRYFISNYIGFWMAFLLAFDCLEMSAFKKAFRVVLFVAILLAGAGTLYNLKYIWPKTFKPGAENAREFESLGRIGIIGNYWNSYIISVTNPDMIVATPDELSSVRNRAMAYKVMERDTIYLIRDGWYDVFPDSLRQFGVMLYKNGDEFRMGDCNVCRYRKRE
jgi:hypothetical protein